MPEKSAIIALVLYAVELFLHWKGRHLSTDDRAALEQFLGLLFGVVASGILYFQSLHNANAANIQAHHDALTATAAAPGKSPAMPAPLVEPTVAGAIVTPTSTAAPAGK